MVPEDGGHHRTRDILGSIPVDICGGGRRMDYGEEGEDGEDGAKKTVEWVKKGHPNLIYQ